MQKHIQIKKKLVMTKNAEKKSIKEKNITDTQSLKMQKKSIKGEKHNRHRHTQSLRSTHNRDVRRDVTGLRIYLCGGQEIKIFACLSMKAQL